MAEVTEATTRIYEEVHDDANIIFGVIFDDTLGDAMRVTVIATGINSREMERLPENVKPMLPKKEKTAQHLPFGEEEPAENQEGTRVAIQRGHSRRPFPQHIFDENELDRPTFIRRNES